MRIREKKIGLGKKPGPIALHLVKKKLGGVRAASLKFK
jgi:hypothetical protein